MHTRMLGACVGMETLSWGCLHPKSSTGAVPGAHIWVADGGLRVDSDGLCGFTVSPSQAGFLCFIFPLNVSSIVSSGNGSLKTSWLAK